MGHKISVPSFYYYVEETLYDLDDLLSLKFPYNDKEWLRKSGQGFSREGRSPLQGCVGALDGIAIKITEPSTKEVKNTSTYYNRKGFFAVNVQALCDSMYRFLYVSGQAAGSTHDSTAFGMCSLCTLLYRDSDSLEYGSWIACDDAYCANSKMLTPWPGRRLSVAQDCFNYWLSSARIHIEQAFGILVARWGIFRRPLRVKVRKVTLVVAVCCKLHNFIIESSTSIKVPEPSGWDCNYHNEQADPTVSLQDECDIEESLHHRRRDLEISSLRTEFTKIIEDLGLKRPAIY